MSMEDDDVCMSVTCLYTQHIKKNCQKRNEMEETTKKHSKSLKPINSNHTNFDIFLFSNHHNHRHYHTFLYVCCTHRKPKT